MKALRFTAVLAAAFCADCGNSGGGGGSKTTGTGGAASMNASTGGATALGSGGRNPGGGGGSGSGRGSLASGGDAGIGGRGTAGGGGDTAGGGRSPMPSTDAGVSGTDTRDGGNLSGIGGSNPPASNGGDGGISTGDAAAVKRWSCPPGPFPMPMPGASQPVCADFMFNYTFNEGPTWVASQNAFYFSNFIVRSPTQGDIIKYTPGGQCEVFVRDVGCNGLAVSNDGNLLAACHQSRSLVRFDLTTKAATTVVDRYMGQLLDTPNDLVVHSNGTIYFTNPNYELGNRPAGIGLAVFRIDPAGVLSLIAQTRSNGIGLSPDEKKLYVLQAGVWDLDAAGVPSNGGNLFTGGDGMAVDCAGNLYASGSIFTPDGRNIGSYGAGTNLAFGGPDGKTLLIVGGGGGGGGNSIQVRIVPMNLPGLP